MPWDALYLYFILAVAVILRVIGSLRVLMNVEVLNRALKYLAPAASDATSSYSITKYGLSSISKIILLVVRSMSLTVISFKQPVMRYPGGRGGARINSNSFVGINCG